MFLFRFLPRRFFGLPRDGPPPLAVFAWQLFSWGEPYVCASAARRAPPPQAPRRRRTPCSAPREHRISNTPPCSELRRLHGRFASAVASRRPRPLQPSRRIGVTSPALCGGTGSLRCALAVLRSPPREPSSRPRPDVLLHIRQSSHAPLSLPHRPLPSAPPRGVRVRGSP